MNDESNRKVELMVEFTHYFIYGNPPEGLTQEKYEEWASTVPKKFNMEVYQ